MESYRKIMANTEIGLFQAYEDFKSLYISDCRDKEGIIRIIEVGPRGEKFAKVLNWDFIYKPRFKKFRAELEEFAKARK